MDMVTVAVPKDNYDAGVEAFAASLGWTYLSCRYSHVQQGLLLRVLTVSGLDPWWWESVVIPVVAQGYRESQLLSTLRQAPPALSPTELVPLVQELWGYAKTTGARIGAAPPAPLHLVEFGYTQPAYLTDLAAVYGAPLPAHYTAPWPQKPHMASKQVIQPIFFRRTVGIMGATAGAIEQLLRERRRDDDSAGK